MGRVIKASNDNWQRIKFSAKDFLIILAYGIETLQVIYTTIGQKKPALGGGRAGGRGS
jgi:hypothetical protein